MRKFYPTAEVDSAYQIDYTAEYENGIRGVLFDVDNTLVPHGAPATDEAVCFFDRLHKLGLKTCIISNNDQDRVSPFADMVDSPYVCKAGKPSAKGYQEGMRLMGTGRETTIFVGDQIFTDIYGANRAGLRNYLVSPIHPKEEIQIVFKRYLEKIVLWFYHHGKGSRG